VAVFAAAVVTSVQRRTTSRTQAYRACCALIEEHGFDALLEHRVRAAVYCRLFPEYADHIGGGVCHV
jgi:hypothetical protein